MIKYYFVYFAKPGVDCTKFEKYLIEAVEYAKCNLLTRYRIKLSWVGNLFDPRGFYIIVDLPPDADFSNPGSRLSGISRHLLKHHKDIFEKYKVGTRLLWYGELLPDSPITITKEVTNNDTEN